jgi:hypothetical protein
LCLILALRFLVAWSRLRSARVAVGVAAWFERLASWGARLGRPLRPADTLREYVRALGETAMHTAASTARSGADQERSEGAAATVRAQSSRLARIYELSLYSSQGFSGRVIASEGNRPWASLWTALRRLWLARWRL